MGGEGGAGVWVMSGHPRVTGHPRVKSGSTLTKYGIPRIWPGWSLPVSGPAPAAVRPMNRPAPRFFWKNENGQVECRNGAGRDGILPVFNLKRMLCGVLKK
jgi:hypothetical protein